MLDALPEAARKQRLGEMLYPIVAAQMGGDVAEAPKVTGMLLDLEPTALLNMYVDPPAMIACIPPGHRRAPCL